MPPSLLFHRLKRGSSQPLLLRHALQDLEHLVDFLQYAHVLFRKAQNRTQYSRSGLIQRRIISLDLQANSTLYAIYHKNVLLTHVQPAVCQNPQLLFCKAASQPVGTNPQHFMGLLNPGYTILIMAYVRDRA